MFVSDETKRQRNLQLHDLDFDAAYRFEWESADIGPTYPSELDMPDATRKVRQLSDAEEATIQAEIAADPDSPELTDAERAATRPAREVLPPEFFEMLERERKKRGRPAAATPKKQVTLRLDADVVESFRAGGDGWQSRINATLRKAQGL
jgi:uncharacterized protein (DUF4415 family)